MVEFLCEVVATEYFTDWYGPQPLNIFEFLESESKAHGIPLSGFDLIYQDNPFRIPSDYDINIAFWDNRRCRDNRKILKKLIRKGPTSSDPNDKLTYDRFAEMLNWVEVALKEKDGALIGIYY